ncbi:hypothetical protein ACFQZ5_03220 [Dactylosporangium darangshiense]|uniref:hypothetical protein n=1 Tax=Dactylosporangium darangshiense TaxID=579108 RepID=UPI00363CC51A
MASPDRTWYRSSQRRSAAAARCSAPVSDPARYGQRFSGGRIGSRPHCDAGSAQITARTSTVSRTGSGDIAARNCAVGTRAGAGSVRRVGGWYAVAYPGGSVGTAMRSVRALRLAAYTPTVMLPMTAAITADTAGAAAVRLRAASRKAIRRAGGNAPPRPATAASSAGVDSTRPASATSRPASTVREAYEATPHAATAAPASRAARAAEARRRPARGARRRPVRAASTSERPATIAGASAAAIPIATARAARAARSGKLTR